LRTESIRGGGGGLRRCTIVKRTHWREIGGNAKRQREHRKKLKIAGEEPRVAPNRYREGEEAKSNKEIAGATGNIEPPPQTDSIPGYH